MSFISKVFGGSGGGIFGAVLNVASMFFPPMALATSLGNLLTQAIGEAVKMAASQLIKQGMPQFIGNLINQAVDKLMPTLMKPSTPEVDEHLSQDTSVQDNLRKFTQDVASDLVDETQKGREGKGTQSWLVALAKALGKVIGAKTERLVELSNKINSLPVNSKDPKVANQMTQATTEMQGVSQELKILQEAVSTTIKSIGDALSSMARRQ